MEKQLPDQTTTDRISDFYANACRKINQEKKTSIFGRSSFYRKVKQHENQPTRWAIRRPSKTIRYYEEISLVPNAF